MVVTALLGPTNTGKTHFAMERLLEQPTGMIGFPLRLLARENYERAVRVRDPDSVALVTGEERITPPRATHYICTVEAMPVERSVDFVAVDEIQLAADRERGHVFTDRLLHLRGRSETMFLGAETIRPLLHRLLPDAAFVTRPRLSRLSYASPRKITRLPRRSAVVVFSVAEVYRLAERLRHELGGAAVVFGALSPRTRNAQVGLYQAGEVDYLVATDAIGMGLNLDIDHVAFTGLSKYDGQGPRHLRPAEVAQIAGRAGRHSRDGTFGATAELGDFDPLLVAAIESHRFEPLRSLFWRNPDLSFASPRALLASLECRPPGADLKRMRNADDHRALEILAHDPEIQRLARNATIVHLLWDVCQIPDYRNVMSEAHARLLGEIFRHLLSPSRRLPEDWVASQVHHLDRTDGDVEALLQRISGIRTWTYVAFREGWLADPLHWRERTREIEDRLSDALHERLTQEFVDRRGAIIARSDGEDLHATIEEDGEVAIQGLRAGWLQGFRFRPERDLRLKARPLLAAANRALRAAMPERVQSFVDAPDEHIALTGEGNLAWRGHAVGRIVRGEDILAPRVEALASELLDPPQREIVRRRLASWADAHLRRTLEPLFALRAADLAGAARGMAFALGESLGAVDRREVAGLVRSLTPADRRQLAALGVRLGRFVVWLPATHVPSTLKVRALLARVALGQPDLPAPSGQGTLPPSSSIPRSYRAACGEHEAGGRAWRIPRLERLCAALLDRERRGPIAVDDALLDSLEASEDEVEALLRALGLRRQHDGTFARTRDGRRGASGSRHPGTGRRARVHAARRKSTANE